MQGSTNYPMKNKILFIGPLPPPSGGASLHISRMTKLIENEFDIELIDESRTIKNNQFNIRSLNLFVYLKKVLKADLIYIHSGVNILRYFHLFIGCLTFKKMILTLHSYPYTKKPVLKFMDEFFFKKADVIFVVNSEILSRLSLPPEKCVIRSAFIPPKMDTEPNLPNALVDWIDDRKSKGKKIICANAWQLKIFNNQDLYGLDICIEVTRQLIENGAEISFAFIVSSLDENKNMFLDYQKIIENSGIKENFLLFNESISFVRLIECSDIVLRPTNTDGDALTVREALFLGKKVIASDAVKRPAGTVTFKSRDVADLNRKISEMISAEDEEGVKQPKESEEDYNKFYSDLLYKTIQPHKKPDHVNSVF